MLLGSPENAIDSSTLLPIRVLVLCTGNSARSILAESIFNSVGSPWFQAMSAGSKPVGRVNPFAIELLHHEGVPTGHLSSKSWLEFSTENSPRFDLLLTVCGSAADDLCPALLAHLPRVNWPLPDPARVTGFDECRTAFLNCYQELKWRISRLCMLPLTNMRKPEVIAAMQALADCRMTEKA